MSPGEFLRRRELIQRNHTRTGAWRKRAMASLERDAGTDSIMVDGVHVGWRLPCGRVACIKRRYSNEALALLALASIRNQPGADLKPVRAYACPWCKGYHLTSMAVKGRDIY